MIEITTTDYFIKEGLAGAVISESNLSDKEVATYDMEKTQRNKFGIAKEEK